MYEVAGVSSQGVEQKWRLLLAGGQDWLKGKPSFTDGVNYHDNDDDEEDDNDDDDEQQRSIWPDFLRLGRCIYPEPFTVL